MRKLFLVVFSLVLPAVLYAQEICDNGLDDDGDGQVDLNDTDCDCPDIAFITGITSLVPNPSFEDTLCCPTVYSQLDECAASWVQASDATSDLFNTCGLISVNGFTPSFPLPGGGNGYAGFLNFEGSHEMVGACLLSPMEADTSYRFSFFLAKGSAIAPSFVVSIYGTPDCNDLPWNGKECPVGIGSWVLLGEDSVVFSDNSWHHVSIEFTPSQDIRALAIGGSCSDASIGFIIPYYYFIDELIVAAASRFDDKISVEESGTWCTGDLRLQAAIDTSGGSWQWYQSGIALPGETSATLNLMQYGTETLFSAIYTLNGQCVRVDYRVDTTDPANQPRALDILNKDTIVCAGTVFPVVAIGTPGYHYQWSPEFGISDPHSLTPDITTDGDTSMLYTLTGSYSGCPDTSQTLLVEIDSPYVVSYKVSSREVCVGSPVYLYPDLHGGVESLSWEFPDHKRPEQHTESVYQHAFEAAGVYPLVLHSTFRACPDASYTDSIRVYPYPVVDLGGDSSICLNGQPLYLKNLHEAPIPYYQVWSTGDTTEVLKVVHPGSYTLSVTIEPIGCTTTESIEIDKDCYIDIPNGFTPNGDGYNDYFLPRVLLTENVTRFRMQVFNRWGQIIFETNRLAGRGWDGRLNGKVQPSGVYLYRVEVTFSNGQREQYAGNVTLVW